VGAAIYDRLATICFMTSKEYDFALVDMIYNDDDDGFLLWFWQKRNLFVFISRLSFFSFFFFLSYGVNDKTNLDEDSEYQATTSIRSFAHSPRDVAAS
jgi:hypothetical protein